MKNTGHPYSDALMTYSHQTHRYTLATDAVRQHLNVDLDTVLNPSGSLDRSAVASAFLAQISREIYSYIYACGVENNVQEYLAAKHPNARPIIFEAMLAQVEYTILNGSIYQLSGIDIRKGATMDQRALRRAQIAPIAQDILSRPLSPTTPCLTYRGTFDLFPLNLKPLPAYETEEY